MYYFRATKASTDHASDSLPDPGASARAAGEARIRPTSSKLHDVDYATYEITALRVRAGRIISMVEEVR